MEKIKAKWIWKVVAAAVVAVVTGATGAVATAAVVAVATGATGAAQAAQAAQAAGLSGELTIAGSTTVLPINQECARLLMKQNPELRISVSGGGSGHGVKAVGAGEIDIGAASRDVKAKELEAFPNLKPVVVGKDSVAIVLHPSNPVSEQGQGEGQGLELEEAAKIFAGEITNWKELGGRDEAIRVVTREEGSGTRDCFETAVLKPFGKEIAANAAVKSSNGEVRATVSSDERSIGYLSLGYLDASVKAVKIDGVAATEENVLSGAYPISRNLYLVTNGAPSELEAAFIDFVLSEEGQEVVDEMGYIKLPVEETLEETLTPELTPKTTPRPTATETPTTTPTQPGFDAVFGVAGLLAVAGVAYAVRRGREKRRK